MHAELAAYNITRLIVSNKTQFPVSPNVGRPANSHRIIMLSSKKLMFFMFAFLIVPGAVAYASFFSFLGDMFSKTSTQENTINSQNISLLSATGGPDAYIDSAYEDVSTVGNSALLPNAGPVGGVVEFDSQWEGENGQISIYVVREGDTMASIARIFDVSVNTILWANNIQRGAKLTVGQVLAILPVSGVKHTVKKGDTVLSIAKKYKGDPDEIRTYNGLDSDMLVINSTVIIPDGEIVQPVVATKKATSAKLRGANAPVIDGYYAAPMTSYRKSQGLHGYNGVDIISYQGVGAPVLASAAGTVVIARSGGYNGGYGTYVVIQHPNGTQTLYGHMKSVNVSTGEVVRQGQQVGTMGNTGRSTGAHLHFEIRGARNPF